MNSTCTPGTRPMPTFFQLPPQADEIDRSCNLQSRPMGHYGLGSNGFGMSIGSGMQLGSDGSIGFQFS